MNKITIIDITVALAKKNGVLYSSEKAELSYKIMRFGNKLNCHLQVLDKSDDEIAYLGNDMEVAVSFYNDLNQ